MQILLIGSLVIAVVLWVRRTRIRRDRTLILEHLAAAGGTARRIAPVRKGSPFPDTGRGWWAWQVEWEAGGTARRSWALTTREGVKEWRDET
jgi:hypothetical protein